MKAGDKITINGKELTAVSDELIIGNPCDSCCLVDDTDCIGIDCAGIYFVEKNKKNCGKKMTKKKKRRKNVCIPYDVLKKTYYSHSLSKCCEILKVSSTVLYKQLKNYNLPRKNNVLV